jgi:diadenosine tetraphosphate (Ap4A) HIT family hydrolase
MSADCLFCKLPPERIWMATKHALAFNDNYPISEGHTLVIPIRHFASIYDLSEEEQTNLWALAGRVRHTLVEKLHPDGFNIGVNDGTAAGQTIAHAHIHIIPRREGDVPDPRGGIRWIIPEKAPYWDKKP